MAKLLLSLKLTLALSLAAAYSQEQPTHPLVWNPNLEEGRYKNPIIYADYSDPDVIRVGDDYYMTSSSFGHFPGLPILHSSDLVNWTIIGHALQNYPFDEFAKPQHGNAIWAPSLRYHNGEFYIYSCDPDRGVFMTKTKDPAGPWEPLKHIRRVTGWIDCCPLWDDDGSAYLVHAFANSRSGIKSLIAVNRMNAEGTEVLDHGVLVFNGQQDHETIEGPKFYKRNGYYYIFAPAGGVKYGWQTILRSENVFGPYIDKIVLEQGSTSINGPHQGAWVTTQTGEDWFIHFQDRYAYGRIVHLQPMRWENDWPVMGEDFDGNGVGEPVSEFAKPNSGKEHQIQIPQTSDDFSSPNLGLQWQWNSNFDDKWFSLNQKPNHLRLYSHRYASGERNLWDIGRLLLQKFPAEEFTATTKLSLNAKSIGERAGLLFFGIDYSYVALEKTRDGYTISQVLCANARRGEAEKTIASVKTKSNEVYLRVNISSENQGELIPIVSCAFSYSFDGDTFHPLGDAFTAREGLWVGAKVGIFAVSPSTSTKTGSADFDWFRVSPPRD